MTSECVGDQNSQESLDSTLVEAAGALGSHDRLNEAIARSPASCPGGHGCTCCASRCDCGCRDACPVFRGIIRLTLRQTSK